jgi:hypothetical protein
MALPVLYIDTSGSSLGSGSSDTANPTHSSTINSVTASVSTTTVTFSGAIDLSAVPADGSATIFINDATNSNCKIFKITAVDDGANTVTVSVAPTGTIATSTWGIGGRRVWNSAEFEGAPAAGWTFYFNDDPAQKSTDFLTLRASGDTTSGFIKVIGKPGAKRKLSVSNTNQCIEISGSPILWYFENMEFEQLGASGNCINLNNSTATSFYDCKFSHPSGGGSADCVGNIQTGCRFINCEFSGWGGVAIPVLGGTTTQIVGCYIHDVGSHGISCTATNPSLQIVGNIFDSCGGNAISLSGAATSQAHNTIIMNNTIYGCSNSGLEITDADTVVTILNNIFVDNGNAAGEANVEWAAGSSETFTIHRYNVLYDSGTGADAPINYTVHATELTTNPLFGNAASGDFSLSSSSPAKAAGFPGAFPGGTSTGYTDIGAVQRQESGAGGAHIIGG